MIVLTTKLVNYQEIFTTGCSSGQLGLGLGLVLMLGLAVSVRVSG